MIGARDGVADAAGATPLLTEFAGLAGVAGRTGVAATDGAVAIGFAGLTGAPLTGVAGAIGVAARCGVLCAGRTAGRAEPGETAGGIGSAPEGRWFAGVRGAVAGPANGGWTGRDVADDAGGVAGGAPPTEGDIRTGRVDGAAAAGVARCAGVTARGIGVGNGSAVGGVPASGGVGVAQRDAGDAAAGVAVGQASAGPAPAVAPGAAAGTAATGVDGAANSSSIGAAAPTMMTPPQTEQRARTPADGTFSGSTRKTELHSGHETFT